MNATWSIRWTLPTPGDIDLLCGEDEAREVADSLAASGEYPDAVAYDRLAELIARYPVGTKVRHTTAPEIGVGVVVGAHRVQGAFVGDSFPGDNVEVHFPGSNWHCWLAHYLAPEPGC